MMAKLCSVIEKVCDLFLKMDEQERRQLNNKTFTRELWHDWRNEYIMADDLKQLLEDENCSQLTDLELRSLLFVKNYMKCEKMENSVEYETCVRFVEENKNQSRDYKGLCAEVDKTFSLLHCPI